MQEKKNIHTYMYIKKYTSPSFSSNILRSSYGINNTKKYLQLYNVKTEETKFSLVIIIKALWGITLSMAETFGYSPSLLRAIMCNM
jgi:hypothetical protein